VSDFLGWRQERHPVTVPLPSNRHDWSNGDCLESKRENYLVCTVQYCVQCTHTVIRKKHGSTFVIITLEKLV